MDARFWLRDLGLGHYASAFAENAIEMDVLPELTEQDLEKLGIPLGDRKRLMKAIRALASSPAAANDFGASGRSEPAPVPTAAERRHLSVLICDLVGSTPLSARLDPEEMGAMLDAFQAECARITAVYDGFLNDFRGDGILAYFGYPRAHEDDAERTVRAALDIIDAVGRLNTPAGERLSVRIGIASGLVVIGQTAHAPGLREHAIVGDTPSIAARLQALAEPGNVIIAASTRRLVGTKFRLRELGLRTLKGIAEPIGAWAVEGISSSENHFRATRAAVLTDLVGREKEMEFLLRRQRLAWEGTGQIVLISGEAGIGKSRLAAALEERIGNEPHTLLRYQCSQSHAQSPLYPFIAQLERAARFKADDTPDQRLDKLEALLAMSSSAAQDTAPLLAALLSIPFGERYEHLALNPAQRRRGTIAALLDLLERLARRNPTLLLFEDVHWADAASLELLDLAAERLRQLPILAVFTARPEFEAPWIGLPNVGALALSPLAPGDAESMLVNLAGGKRLPAEVTRQILEKTDGNPLFLEELTKAVLETDIVAKDADGYRLRGPIPSLAIPDTLHDSLMSRLDRLAPVKEVAQIGAVIGREFPYALLRYLVARDEIALKLALDKLEEAELVFRRGEPPDYVYSFKHALIRDTAYESLLKTRRKQLHGQIALSLQANFPEIGASQPEIVARHFTEAGIDEPAVNYWLKAGNLALSRSAQAAIGHLEQGLRLVGGIENQRERNKAELLLRISLGNALRATEGWSAETVRDAYTRALELCRETGLDEHTFPAVFGLWTWNFLRAEVPEAEALAERLSGAADVVSDDVYKVLAHEAIGFTLFAQGKFRPAHVALQHSLKLSDRIKPDAYLDLSAQEPSVHVRLYDAIVVWMLGFPDQARRLCEEARIHADASRYPFSDAMARTISLRVYQLRGETGLVEDYATQAIALCQEHEFAHYLAMALILRGWARAKQGNFEEGLAEMQQGLEKERATGAVLFDTYTLALMADVCITNKHYLQALEYLNQSQSKEHQEGSERFFSAEIYRLLGEAYLQAGEDLDEAERYFSKGLKIAREQNAKSLELRLCVSLYDLHRVKGTAHEYRRQLCELYESFTEGFETEDLIKANTKMKEHG
jgi:class 3 adenylate cyclase/tetratricopeptide (TPR) repeat protein